MNQFSSILYPTAEKYVGKKAKLRLLIGPEKMFNGQEVVVSRPMPNSDPVGMYWFCSFFHREMNANVELKVEFFKLYIEPTSIIPAGAPVMMTGANNRPPPGSGTAAMQIAWSPGVAIQIVDWSFPSYVWSTVLSLDGIPPDFYQSMGIERVSRPLSDPDGKIRYWGIEPMDKVVRFSPERITKVMTRIGSDDFMRYGAGEAPEQKLVKAMAARRMLQISANKKSRADIYRKVFVVRIKLEGLTHVEVHRKIRVSGGMSLRAFADKVISPAMGWERSYHCYYFMDTRDGCLYGQEEPKGVDNMFLPPHGFSFINDEKVKIGDLLSSDGDTLEYVYDLGIRWQHIITVLSVTDPPVSEAERVGFSHCVVLDGKGACPPEDGNGNDSEHLTLMSAGMQDSTMTIDTFYLGENGNDVYDRSVGPGGVLSDPKHKDYVSKHADAFGSKPGSSSGKIFDWTFFNLAATNDRLTKALNSRNSTGGGGSHCDCCVADQSAPVKESKRLHVCRHCSNGNNLMYCSSCRVIFYCSAACQKADWARHKPECKFFQKSAKFKK